MARGEDIDMEDEEAGEDADAEGQEGDEGPEELILVAESLEELHNVATECESNYKRLKTFAESLGKTLSGAGTPAERLSALEETVQTLGAELAATVMSLLADLGGSTFDGQCYQHQYLQDEVEPMLRGEDGPAPSGESYLSEPDAAMLGSLIGGLHAGNAAMADAGAVPPEMREAHDAFRGQLASALARLHAIRDRAPNGAPASESDAEPEPAEPDDAPTEEQPSP